MSEVMLCSAQKSSISWVSRILPLGAIYKQATTVLLILGTLAGTMQLLDAGIGLFEHDLGKFAGRPFARY